VKISVIVSAYDNWQALHWTLLGYRCQMRPCDELIVAEDSEFPEVAQVIERHRARAPFPIIHLTQEDLGFRKCSILNEAILAAQGNWLVFTDADCVPRADLLATHERLARPGRFLSGGSHVNLPPAWHARHLTEQAVLDQSLFDRRALQRQGVNLPSLRMRSSPLVNAALDLLTPRNAFVGCNAGVWRRDALAVRGFDESFGYGGEDRNFGIRLNNLGVKGVQHKHSLAWLHLDHPRGYTKEDQVRAQKQRNREVRESRAIEPAVSRITPSSP
jgi:cellulose synthase/poly-beta-1,6-N-acetylglucosamine synthase-like glycosyltransferase